MFVGLLGEMIEPTGTDVGLQSLIPCLGDISLEPGRKGGQLRRRKLNNR